MRKKGILNRLVQKIPEGLPDFVLWADLKHLLVHILQDEDTQEVEGIEVTQTRYGKSMKAVMDKAKKSGVKNPAKMFIPKPGQRYIY